MTALLSSRDANAGIVKVTSFPGTTVVGTQSGVQVVAVTFDRAGTLGSINVVTQGAAGADFADAQNGTCAVGQAYAPGQQCTVTVTLTPAYPGQRTGAVILEANDATVLGTSFLTGVGKGSLAVLNPGRIDTIAGNGAWIFRGDGYQAILSPIFLPMGEAVDASGNLYLSDSNNNRVRRVDAQTHLMSTIAGTGNPGASGDGGLATNAMVSSPAGLLLDGAGNLYFADSANHAVRRVDALTGIITTVAGTAGVQGYAGDGGAATAAKLSFPEGIALDASLNLLIADTGNNAIRRIDANTGIITTVAGTGTAGYNGDGIPAVTARLSGPWGVTASVDGSFFIADLSNNRVRKVDVSGTIGTVAGSGDRSFSGDGAAATQAALNAPASVVVDPAGNLYIADSGNNRVRKVNSGTGVIQTVVGGKGEQFDGDGGPASAASLYGPYSLFMDAAGNLYISDMFHNRIREVSSTAVALQYATIRVSKTSPPQPESLENDGNADLSLAAIALDNAALDPATTTCTIGALHFATACQLGVEFAPTAVGDQILGSVNLKSDASNSPAVVTLSGTVLTVEPTSVALTSSANPGLVSTPITFTAVVTSADTSRSGTIVFSDGAAQLCSTALDTNASATCTVSTLSLGQHNVVANYSGDANNASSASPALAQVIKQAATLVLQTTPNPATVSGSVTLTLTAAADHGTPTGNVVFLDGTTAIGGAVLNAAGTATFSSSTLAVGTHALSVRYDGDSNDASAQSNVVQQVIARASTTTTLGSSSETADVGTSVTFTATITSAGGPTPTGSVTFTDGSNTLGIVNLDAKGLATITLSSLAPGTHQITAGYAGDTNSSNSTAPALTETIQQLKTTSALSSDANPADAGNVLHLVATITGPASAGSAGAVNGIVSFLEGKVSLGAANVNEQGVATIGISTLAVGQHTITAVYQGNTNFAGSISNPLAQQVKQSATTTVLGSNNTSSVAGTPVSFVATVSTTGGTATGTITFRDGSTVLGQPPVDSQGKSTLTLSNLAVGTHQITATYGGDSNYLTSASNALPQSVIIASTNITLSASSNPVDAGTNLVLTSVLSGNGGHPTGTITIKDGPTVLGIQPVNSSNSFTFNDPSATVGTHTFTASYSGDANDAASNSAPLTVVVQQAATTLSIKSSQNPAVLNQALTLIASASSSSKTLTGGITFYDGSAALGTASLDSAGNAILTTSTLTVGSHTISASYAGDTIHAAATSSPLTQQVVQAAALSITSTPNPSVAGLAVSFSAKVFGAPSASPTGTVTFYDAGSIVGTAQLDASGTATLQVSSLAVGQHTITVSYTGDKAYQAISSSPLLQIVKSADTQVSFTTSASPTTFNTTLVMRAAVTGNGGPLKGTVSFQEGSTVLGRATLDVNGIAVASTGALTPGKHLLTANYSGDGNNAPATSAELPEQVQQITSTALASNLNPTPTLSPVTLTATVSNGSTAGPTGIVRFTDGATVLGIVTLDANGIAALTIPPLSAGNHSLQASYSGDTANFSSVGPTLTEGVLLRPTTNSLTASATSLTGGQQETLIAVLRWSGSVPPTGSMTFTSGGNVIGTATVDSTGVATLTVLLKSSSETVVASYSGDSAYAASDSPMASINSASATQFTMQTNPPALTLQSKQHSTIDLTISSVKGFSDTLALGCLGLPYAATCTFSADNVQLSANGQTVVHVVIDTGSPLTAGGQAQARRNTAGHASTAVLCFLPGGALLAALLLRPRKFRHIRGLVLVLFIASLAAGITGCGSLDVNGTPPGSYVIKISAAAKQTGITLTQSMTVTVLK